MKSSNYMKSRHAECKDYHNANRLVFSQQLGYAKINNSVAFAPLHVNESHGRDRNTSSQWSFEAHASDMDDTKQHLLNMYEWPLPQTLA